MRTSLVVMLVVIAARCTLAGSGGPTPPLSVVAREERVAIERLAARWVSAVANRDEEFVEMLSAGGTAYYDQVRRFALHAEAEELAGLDPVDQLQAMLLRTIVETDELRSMSERQLLIFAVKRGLLGYDLRRTDVLRDVVVQGASATGRLYKFGLEDRPDRTMQYFVKENGQWRVDLRSELVRLQADFDSFLKHSQLSPSEGAFFILEARLMRKVTSADFDPPLPLRDPVRHEHATSAPTRGEKQLPSQQEEPVLRLVAIRHAIDSDLPSAVTIEDRLESLRYVLGVGDALPPRPNCIVDRIESDRVVLRQDGIETPIALEPHGDALSQRLTRPGSAKQARKSLFHEAQLGDGRDGIMAQWRNVGLRGRPQLLQQAWMTPVYEGPPGTERSIKGLQVEKIANGSFWQQLGLQQGDRLVEMNGLRIDSLDAWRQIIEIAEDAVLIEIRVRRGGRDVALRTKTIPPKPIPALPAAVDTAVRLVRSDQEARR